MLTIKEENPKWISVKIKQFWKGFDEKKKRNPITTVLD